MMKRIFAAVAFLLIATATAQVLLPQEHFDRLVELRVEQRELNVKMMSGELSQRAAGERGQEIHREEKEIDAANPQISMSEWNEINNRINAAVERRVALLSSQWQQRTDAFKSLAKERNEQNAAQLEADARTALGQEWARHFDTRVSLLTQALAGNPDTPIHARAVTAGKEGAPPDYNRDLQRAAELWARKEESQKRYQNKEITGDTHRENDMALVADINRLAARYPGREREFFDASAKLAQRGGEPVATTAAPSPPPKQYKSNGWIGWAIGIGIFLALVVYVFRPGEGKPAKAPPPVTTNHGTAQWAPMQTAFPDASALTRGVFLGMSSTPDVRSGGAPIITTPEHHTLIVARTRAGKGTRIIVPTMLRYGGAMLVIDPKGENAAITARVRRDDMKQAVHVVNPWNELPGPFGKLGLSAATYNPLDVLDRNDPNAVAIAQSLAAAICPMPSGDKEKFWQGSAASFLAGVFLWIADQPTERKTLARAREIVSLAKDELEKRFLIPMTQSEGFHGAIREFAGPFVGMAPETYSGVMANLAEATKFLSDPQIKQATAESSFSMLDLVRGNTTVYLVIPPDRIETQRTWLRLVVAAAMHTFKRAGDHDRAKQRCQFLIDEFALLGRMEDLPRDIAEVGKNGIDFTLIVQGVDQIKANYGEAESATILSNCAYKWFCSVNDLSSAKYLSEVLGKKTVQTVSQSDSYSKGDKSFSEGSSTSYNEMGRELLTPDEVLNLGREVAIGLQPHGPPHYLRPVDYWNLPTSFAHLRTRHPALYWPLDYDKNPYHRGDGKAA